MKRLWLGIILLLVLLIMGFTINWTMEKVHSPAADALKEAAEAAESENWQKTAALIQQSRAEWEHYRKLTSAVCDHEPIEEIDGLFCQAAYYVRFQKTADCAALCAQLAEQIRLIGTSHNLNWSNFL